MKSPLIGSRAHAWATLIRATAVLPLAVVIWLPFMVALLWGLRPIIEFVAQVFTGQTVAALAPAGLLEWTLETNLAFHDKPDQLFDIALQPQHFLLPFPLVWAGLWAVAPRQNKARYLLAATAVTLVAAMLPMLLQVLSAASYAAHTVGLDTVVTTDSTSHRTVSVYVPVAPAVVQVAGFVRTVVVYFNLFVLPPLVAVVASEWSLPAPSPPRQQSRKSQNARRRSA